MVITELLLTTSIAVTWEGDEHDRHLQSMKIMVRSNRGALRASER